MRLNTTNWPKALQGLFVQSYFFIQRFSVQFPSGLKFAFLFLQEEIAILKSGFRYSMKQALDPKNYTLCCVVSHMEVHVWFTPIDETCKEKRDTLVCNKQQGLTCMLVPSSCSCMYNGPANPIRLTRTIHTMHTYNHRQP